MDLTTINAQEIRAEFAQRLVRRFEMMAKNATFPARQEVWEGAARIVQLMLDEYDEFRVDKDQ